MDEVADISALRAWVGAHRARGERIGFVPTMGFLHEGHLALVDAARRGGTVVMSIFVNPLQFGPTEDLARYPRDLPRDRELAGGRGVNLLFVPTVETMYPAGAETRVVPGALAERWEGGHRPGHFAGVLTVVAKLFHLVQPDTAWFGQKDFQQVAVVRRMVRDLDWPIAIEVLKTVRDADGLALSSRNAYLSSEERSQALGLSRALRAACEGWRAGQHSGAELEQVMRDTLTLHPGVTVDYIAVVAPDTLQPVKDASSGDVAMLAARVGRTRLIDNAILGEGL